MGYTCLRDMGEDGACRFLFQDSGEAGKPRKAFLMSKCLLMLMHFHIVVPNYPHFIDVLNVRSNATMNNIILWK